MAKKKAVKKKASKKPADPKAVKPARKRAGRKTIAESLTRRKTVMEMLIRGYPIPMIVDTLSVTRKSIQKDIEAFYAMYHESQLVDFDDKVCQQMAKIDHVEQCAYEGWERSLNPKTTEERNFYAIDIEGDEDGITEVYDLKKKMEEQGGNPAFLNVVLKCIAERSKLLGLDKREDEQSDVDDVPIVTVVVESKEDIHDVMVAQEVLKINSIEGKVLGKK